MREERSHAGTRRTGDGRAEASGSIRGAMTTVAPQVLDAVQLEDMFQVILYNDDVNTMDHVVKCLIEVFGHPVALAMKIMREADRLGRAVAEVEPESQAKLHVEQLRSFGLVAEMQRL